MKKITILLLTITILFSFVLTACSNKDNNSNTSIATIPSKEPNNNTYGTHATSTNALKPDVKSLAEQHPDLNYVIGTVYSIERFATVSGQQISLGNYRGIDEEEFAIKSEFPDVLYYAHARIQIGVDNFTEITPFVPETVLKDIYSNLQPESAVNQHILEMTVVPSMSALFKVYNANDYTLPDNIQKPQKFNIDSKDAVSNSSSDIGEYKKSNDNTSVEEKPVETQNDLYRSNLTYPRMDDIHNSELSSDKIFIEVSQVIEEFDKLCENYMNTGDTEVFEYLKENTTAYEQQVEYKQNHPNLTQHYSDINVQTVRQNGNNYYVWVSERISQTENGKEKVIENDWVYRLHKNGNQWYIDDYTKNPLSK